MSQTGFIILIILFVAAMLLLFWWMTRQPGGTRDGSGNETAAALGSLVPDEGGDTSPPATIKGESIAPDPLPVVTPPPPLPTPLSPVAESPAAPVAPAAPPERDIGIVAPQAADGAVDNLLLMKGVGPKLAARLGELGVTRFDQIAGWTDADIDRIDAELGTFRGRIRRDQWVDQAGYLARGDHKGFAAKYGNI